jgi:hypothetical protein
MWNKFGQSKMTKKSEDGDTRSTMVATLSDLDLSVTCFLVSVYLSTGNQLQRET